MKKLFPCTIHRLIPIIMKIIHRKDRPKFERENREDKPKSKYFISRMKHFCLSVFQVNVEKEVTEILPWYIKWNVLRLFSIVCLLLLLYLFWIKREIWLESRVRRSIVTKTETNLDDTSSVDSSPKEDLIENSEEKDNTNDDILIKRSNSSSAKQSKKSFLLPRQNSTIHYSTYNDLLETIRTNLKSRINERKFVLQLSKLTGLTRIQLNRFVYKKDFRLITFERFVTFLDLFDLMILIVPKKDLS